MEVLQHGGFTIALVASEGPALSGETGALDVIGQTYGLEADYVAVPVSRMAPASWTLANRELGGFTQKFTNYRLRLGFIGDLTAEIAASTALRDYVRESTARGDVIFAADLEAFLRRLDGRTSRGPEA